MAAYTFQNADVAAVNMIANPDRTVSRTLSGDVYNLQYSASWLWSLILSFAPQRKDAGNQLQAHMLAHADGSEFDISLPQPETDMVVRVPSSVRIAASGSTGTNQIRLKFTGRLNIPARTRFTIGTKKKVYEFAAGVDSTGSTNLAVKINPPLQEASALNETLTISGVRMRAAYDVDNSYGFESRGFISEPVAVINEVRT